MTTDNWPVEFRYISRRMTTEIVQMDAARRAQFRGEVAISANANTQLTGDESNPFELVLRATEAVSNLTTGVGTKTPARYVRTRMHLQEHVIPLDGWRIAAYGGIERVGDELCLVALFGSASNLISWRDNERGVMAGRSPSNATGLYELILATQEPDDEPLEAWLLERDARIKGEYADEVRWRIQEAVGLLDGSAFFGPARYLETLFRVHWSAEDVSDLGIRTPDGRSVDRFDHVMVGAPLWVATPEAIDPPPAAIPVYQPEPLDEDQWERAIVSTDKKIEIAASGSKLGVEGSQLDAALTQYRSIMTHRSASEELIIWPISEEIWNALGRWFAGYASRSPMPLIAASRPRRQGWRRRPFVKRRVTYATTDEHGWFVAQAHRRLPRAFVEPNVMVLTNGGIWRANHLGEIADRSPVGFDDPDGREILSSILHAVVEITTPFWSGHSDDVPVILPSGEMIPLRTDRWNRIRNSPGYAATRGMMSHLLDRGPAQNHSKEGSMTDLAPGEELDD